MNRGHYHYEAGASGRGHQHASGHGIEESGEVQHQIKSALEKLAQLMHQQENALEEQGVSIGYEGGNLEDMAQTSKIQEFLEMLKLKYLKLAEKLKDEQEKKEYAEMENVALKTQLSAELQKHDDLVQNAKVELHQLMEKNQKYLKEVQDDEKLKEGLEHELHEKERVIEALTSKLKLRMDTLMHEKERKQLLEGKFFEMQEELENVKQVYDSERSKGEELEENFRNLEQEYNTSFKKLKTLTDKHNALKQQLEKAMQEHYHFEEEKKAKLDELTLHEKKLETLKRRLAEQEETHERLVNEVKMKNDEMNKIRKENQEIEGKLKNLVNIEGELDKVIGLKNKLIVENEILCHQLKVADAGADIGKYSYKHLLKLQEGESNSNELEHVKENLLNKFRLENPPNLLMVEHEIPEDLGGEDQDEINRALVGDFGEGSSNLIQHIKADRVVDDMKNMQHEIDLRKSKDTKQSLDVEYYQQEMEEKERALKDKDSDLAALKEQMELLTAQINHIMSDKRKAAGEYGDLQNKMAILTGIYSNIVADSHQSQSFNNTNEISGSGSQVRGSKSLLSEQQQGNKDEIDDILALQPKKLKVKHK